MERKPVSSSNIRSVGFENGEMHIEFTNGNVYSYTGEKAEEHYKGLMAAESKGRYFTQNIRHCPKTTCTKVPPK